MIPALALVRADLEIAERFDVDGLHESAMRAWVEWLSLVWRREVYDEAGRAVDGSVHAEERARGVVVFRERFGGSATAAELLELVATAERLTARPVRWLRDWRRVAVVLVVLVEAGRGVRSDLPGG